MKELNVLLLERIKDNDFDLSIVEDKLAFTYDLLEWIGVEDPYQRDELIYPVLARLLYRDHLADSDLIEILKVLFSDSYLRSGLGAIDNSVFKRTFTALQIAVILFKHNEKSFIPKDDYAKFYDQFLEYYLLEKDMRGYLKEEGWAHSIAHAADVFKQFAQANELIEFEYMKMLEVIKTKFMQSDYFFINNEDERTVSAIELLISRKIVSEENIKKWIQSFEGYVKDTDYKKEFIINTNIKNLLRSLYFRNLDFRGDIEKVLESINPFKK